MEKDQRLYDMGGIARIVLLESQKRYDNARDIVKSKEDQLVRTQARVKEMGEQSALQKKSVVTMPADGLVWTIAGKPGEQVDADHLVMEIINPDHIWVDAFFSERRVNELRPGMRCGGFLARQHREVARLAGIRPCGRGPPGL